MNQRLRQMLLAIGEKSSWFDNDDPELVSMMVDGIMEEFPYLVVVGDNPHSISEALYKEAGGIEKEWYRDNVNLWFACCDVMFEVCKRIPPQRNLG